MLSRPPRWRRPGLRPAASWKRSKAGERLEDLNRDRDALLERYANVTGEALDELSAEERNKLYKMLKLRVVLGDDGTPEVSGVLCEDLELPAESGEPSDIRNDVPAALSV
jgi:hypothetical protein